MLELASLVHAFVCLFICKSGVHKKAKNSISNTACRPSVLGQDPAFVVLVLSLAVLVIEIHRRFIFYRRLFGAVKLYRHPGQHRDKSFGLGVQSPIHRIHQSLKNVSDAAHSKNEPRDVE